MPASERTLSEFLQHPNTVMPDVARGPVVLHRRGAEDLVIMTREHSEALEEAVRVVATAVKHGKPAPDAALPWLGFLSPQDQRLCLHEIATATSAAMSTGRFDLLRDTLYGWQATGLAAWDEQNRGGARYDEEAPVPVPQPRRGRASRR